MPSWHHPMPWHSVHTIRSSFKLQPSCMAADTSSKPEVLNRCLGTAIRCYILYHPHKPLQPRVYWQHCWNIRLQSSLMVHMLCTSCQLLLGQMSQDKFACISSKWYQKTTLQYHRGNKSSKLTMPRQCGTAPLHVIQSMLIKGHLSLDSNFWSLSEQKQVHATCLQYGQVNATDNPAPYTLSPHYCFCHRSLLVLRVSTTQHA